MSISNRLQFGDSIEVSLDENKKVWLEATFVRFVGETRVTVQLKTPTLVIERTRTTRHFLFGKIENVEETASLFTTFTTGLGFVR